MTATASGISATLGSAGPGELFESNGKIYALSHITPRICGEFSAWCKLRARRGITESREWLTPDEYHEDLNVFQEAVAAGHYNWGAPTGKKRGIGKAVANIIDSVDGRFRLLALLLKERHGDLDDDQVREIVEGADSEELRDALGMAMEVYPNGLPPEGRLAPGATRRRERQERIREEEKAASDRRG